MDLSLSPIMDILTQGPLNLLRRLSQELDQQGISSEIVNAAGSTRK